MECLCDVKEVANLDERLLGFSNCYFLLKQSTHGSVDRSAFGNVLNLARFIFATGIELQLPSCNLF